MGAKSTSEAEKNVVAPVPVTLHVYDLGVTGEIGMADFWKVSFTEHQRLALDTLKVAYRSLPPSSKTNDFLDPFDNSRGPGPPIPADLGASGSPAWN